MITRRLTLLGGLLAPALAGCAAPLAPLQTTRTTDAARALLAESAAAHGLAAFAALDDLNVSYLGAWRPVVGSLQPALVNAEFRGGSQERLLLRQNWVAQAHTGPAGQKQVLRQTDAVRVWFNGAESQDNDARHAAALVADDYGLFLLGPMLLAGNTAGRTLVMETAAPETLEQDGQEYPCDVLRVRLVPGLGLSARDEIALSIDRAEKLMRRVRFSLDGLDSTQGAVAEVDTQNHVMRHGVRWPTRFHERLLRPLPLPVHDWQLTGLDVNRGLTPDDIAGPTFTGRAIPPAAVLA